MGPKQPPYRATVSNEVESEKMKKGKRNRFPFLLFTFSYLKFPKFRRRILILGRLHPGLFLHYLHDRRIDVSAADTVEMVEVDVENFNGVLILDRVRNRPTDVRRFFEVHRAFIVGVV